jgi:hypothetical protein
MDLKNERIVASESQFAEGIPSGSTDDGRFFR